MARKCRWCGDVRPGMQPLRLGEQRGYWHPECFKKAVDALRRREEFVATVGLVRNAQVAEPLRTVVNQISECPPWPLWQYPDGI